MNLIKHKYFLITVIILALMIASSANAQKKTETNTAKSETPKPAIIKIYGVQLTILTLPDKTELSKTPVNNSGAGGFKVSKPGTYYIKATFGKKVDEATIKELNIDIKYPDGIKKTLSTTPASNGKSVESAEFEWTEISKPIFAYLTSTQGKISTPAAGAK